MVKKRAIRSCRSLLKERCERIAPVALYLKSNKSDLLPSLVKKRATRAKERRAPKSGKYFIIYGYIPSIHDRLSSNAKIRIYIWDSVSVCTRDVKCTCLLEWLDWQHIWLVKANCLISPRTHTHTHNTQLPNHSAPPPPSPTHSTVYAVHSLE